MKLAGPFPQHREECPCHCTARAESVVASYSLQRGLCAPRSLCVRAQLCLFVALLQTVARQAPLSMDFFKQEDWSRLPFPTPEDLPDPGIEPPSFACAALEGRFFITMAPHSSTLAWKIPWMEEPGRPQSMGVTSLSLFTFMHWRRKWQPTPVFLPGESQGQGSLVGCRLWVAQSRTRLK